MPLDLPPAGAAPKVISVKEVEALVRRLRGVLACRIVTLPGGGIDEIHVLADGARPAKMIVRDIESALRAQWNLTLERNKVSVAQVDAAGAPSALRQAVRPRLRVVRAEVEPAQQMDGAAPLVARVVLARSDGEESVGVAAGAERSAALAQATLRAAEGVGEHAGGRLQLVALSPVALGGQIVLTLVVSLRTTRGTDLLTGSALVRGEAERAVVAATLDAVNRRLSSLEPTAGAPNVALPPSSPAPPRSAA